MARLLDGVNDYVAVPDSATMDVGDLFSWSLWIKRGRTGVLEVLFTKGSNSLVPLIETNNRLSLYGSSLGNLLMTTATIADTNWHHLAIVKNGGTSTKAYLDGTDVGGTFTNKTLLNTNHPQHFGVDGDATPTGAWFSGAFAEIGLWNVALSAAEAATLARGVSAGRVRRSALALHLPLWGLASPEADLSGNKNNGTVTGATATNHAPVARYVPAPGVTAEAVTSTTEVSTTRDIRWSVLQAIPAVRDLRWSVIGQITKASDLRWGVLQAIGTTRDLRWSVSTALSTTRDLRWSVLAALSTSRDLRWAVLQATTTTRDLRWSVEVVVVVEQTRVVTTPERTASFPLGVFLLVSPLVEVRGGGQRMVTYEAYDQSQILADDRVTARYVVAGGANVVTEVRALLVSAAIVKQNLTASALTLASTLTWEPGTPKLTIINDLLRLINYVSLYFDSSGYATCRPYVVPTDAPVAYEYRDDAISVIHDEGQRTLDLFSVPNTWVVMVSDADRELTSTVTNDNPDSPTSTVTRGHAVVSFRSARPEDAVDQTTLDALAERIAFEESQIYETVRFTSAIMPFHGEAEVLWLEHSALGVDGKYQEIGWDFELVAGARMVHQARRVVSV